MSNTYFVTLSYGPEDAKHYDAHLKAIAADLKNKKILQCKQLGKNRDHLHYHLVIETDTTIGQKYRMRFRTYMKPMVMDKTNLVIKHTTCPGVYLNYFKRDPTSEVTNVRGWDMEALQKQADHKPDRAYKPVLFWSIMYDELRAIGWDYPQKPAKYLLELSKKWDVNQQVCNPRRVAQMLAFYGSKDGEAWDDMYKHIARREAGEI